MALKHYLGNGSFSTLKKHALFSLLLRGVSMLVSFLLVPLSISFVGKEQYGIWLTISSIIAWLTLLDIGLGYGLRNNLVKAFSSGKFKLAKIYVSTTYVVLTCFIILILVLFFIIEPFLNWTSILNISPELSIGIRKVIVIIFVYFCMSFLLKIVNSILYASQKAAFSSIIDTGGQFLSLLTVYMLAKYVDGSLLYLCIAMCLMPALFALFFNLRLFKGKYRSIAPSVKYFRVWSIRQLLGLSLKFFIIQIAAVIQYQTANIIIAKSFSIVDVTAYNITVKYFSILTIFLGLIVAPLWSAITEAYNREDFKWIRNVVRKYLFITSVLMFASVVLLFAADTVYHIWIDRWVGGEDVLIPFSLSFWCMMYTIFSLPGFVFVNVLNGIGAVKIQFILSLITPILYVILCVILISYFKLGVYSVFIASIISNVNGFIIAPIQYMKIFIYNKKGIWIAS